ncbi:MAG TPA: hypothetical protein VNO33_05645 [Kofleriaceae bacterium]|nr:hypothetical protein [Kofleriaceae bacterium]
MLRTGLAGDYNLAISAVIKSGQACDQRQIDAGIMECAPLTTCIEGTCRY